VAEDRVRYSRVDAGAHEVRVPTSYGPRPHLSRNSRQQLFFGLTSTGYITRAHSPR
jgi:hypothetical protein